MTWIDIAPFIAAIAVQIISIPIQGRVSTDLKLFHRNKQTTGPTISSTPEDIARKFIVDSDYIAAMAAGVTFVASATVVLLSKEKFDTWTLSTYILLAVVFLGACSYIHHHYREAYGLYKKHSYKRATPATMAVLAINIVGMIGLAFVPS